jgi:hypothetical protein
LSIILRGKSSKLSIFNEFSFNGYQKSAASNAIFEAAPILFEAELLIFNKRF